MLVTHSTSRGPQSVLFFSTRKLQPIHDHINVCLPHLRILHLTLDVLIWDEGNRGPFEHFLFPALKTFNLYIVTDHLDNANTLHRLWDLSIDFACQYATSLQNREIDGQFITSPPSFLGHFPKLKHLGVPIKLFNGEFIHELVRRFSSSVQHPCQGVFHLESLFVFAVKEKTLRAIIDHAVKESSSTAVHPVIIIVPDGLLDSFILPPGCMVGIMGRGEDLYKEIGWEYFRG
ncbi:hypothetical protein BD410DRAFT_844549 [Rickenella mellea]|uniref:Uncharacterized protein n=1 Tax=Rickenella mellea TaxID=50990 RepID=A0A4Y7PN41_9AGAM|nr:hypothetical protein BD410DRAFT_844549 [Rickenella mellea]